MTRNLFCKYVLAIITMAVASANTFAVDLRRLSVDDMMQVEGFGGAASDPMGRWLVYERLRPYEQSDDFRFRSYANGKTGHQLWRYDLKIGGAPSLLPGLDPVPHSYQQGFSASGRYLAIMQFRYGALSLGAYDMMNDEISWFPQTPAFSREGTHNPVWISESELVFTALPEGVLPQATSVRVHTGRTLMKAWEDAWRGDIVTASEVRRPTQDESAQQEAGYLVRANATTGESQVLAEGLYADLRVSPDRRYLAALAVSKPRPTDPATLVEDDPRRFSLTLFDLDTGQAQPLVPELEFFQYSIAWSPDSTRVALYGWPIGQGPRNGRFYVYDVTSGATVQYEHIGLDLASERERGLWPRPERVVFLEEDIAVFARRIPVSEDQHPRFTDKDVEPVNLPKADWYALGLDGSVTNLTEGLPSVSGLPVHAGEGHITVTSSAGVYRLYADGRRLRMTPTMPGRYALLSAGTFATESVVVRPEFTDEALFTVSGDGPTKLVMIDLRDGHEVETIVVDAPSADAMPLAGSLAAGAVLFHMDEGQVSQLLVAMADTEGMPSEIARINTHLADIELGHWQVVSYEVPDTEGKRPMQVIESCVLLPPGHNPSDQPPPLIVEVYPSVGPGCKSRPAKINSLSVSWSPYLWASKGYAYARLTTPRELLRTADGPIAGMPDVLDVGVDALVNSGFADPERVAIVGFSQGGISALYVASKSERYKAVIAMNSWADLFSHYFGPSGIWSYVYGEYFGNFVRYDRIVGGDFGIGVTPFEDPDIFIRNSPVFLAPGINAPVLLIHSDLENPHMSQFDEMYGALLRAGKDARYVRYWGEGHGPSSPANIRDLWKRIDSFLSESGVAPKVPQ